MKEAIIGGAVSGLTTWALQNYWSSEVVGHIRNILQSLVVSFLPLWIAMIVGGAVWVVRDYLALRKWIGPEAVQYQDAFREWLRHQEPAGFQYMVRRSLDDRIATQIAWWEQTHLEHRMRETLTKLRKESPG